MLGLRPRHHLGADWLPQLADHEAGGALRTATGLEAIVGLGAVVVDVPALLLHDPAEHLGEHGVVGLGDQSCVTTLGGPLVDDAEGHVHGQEVLGGRREGHPQDGAGSDLPSEPLAHGRHPHVAAGLAVSLQHSTQGLAVPVLLEAPHGEERGDLGVVVGLGVEQVPEVAGGVLLHVVHVAEAAQVLRRQRLIPERIEVDAVEVELTGDALVGGQVERHARSSYEMRGSDDRAGWGTGASDR